MRKRNHRLRNQVRIRVRVRARARARGRVRIQVRVRVRVRVRVFNCERKQGNVFMDNYHISLFYLMAIKRSYMYMLVSIRCQIINRAPGEGIAATDGRCRSLT